MTVHEQFKRDMTKAKIAVRHYDGRNQWSGPACVTDIENGLTLQDVIRATKVAVQWEQLGKHDHVVYPVARESAKVA